MKPSLARVALAAMCLLIVVATSSTARAAVVDDRPSGVVASPGHVHMFARGAGGTLLTRWWSDGSWNQWQDFGGMSITSGPSANVRPDGTIDVFAKGPDDQIYHRYHTITGPWTEWGSIGGTATSAPASSVRNGTNTIDVVVKGGDGAFYFKYWSPSTGWSGWASLGGTFKHAPAISSTEPGKFDVWGVGTDGQLYQKHWNGAVWTPWIALGGNLNSAPTVVSQAPGRVDVFATDYSQNVAQRSWDGASWSAWVAIPTVATSAPFAYSEGVGRVDLYVRGGDEIYQNQFVNGTWFGWGPWGGTGRAPDDDGWEEVPDGPEATNNRLGASSNGYGSDPEPPIAETSDSSAPNCPRDSNLIPGERFGGFGTHFRIKLKEVRYNSRGALVYDYVLHYQARAPWRSRSQRTEVVARFRNHSTGARDQNYNNSDNHFGEPKWKPYYAHTAATTVSGGVIKWHARTWFSPAWQIPDGPNTVLLWKSQSYDGKCVASLNPFL